MYSIDPEEVKELEFRHLKFRHKLIYGRRNRRTHGNIQVSFFCPKICVVCGSSQITGYRKLLNDKGFRNITKGIRVSVCKNHLYDDEKMRANLQYALLCGSAFLVLLALIFEWFFFLGMALFFGILLYMVYRLAKKEAKVQKSHIVNYLTFNFFSEYSVISIKREDWADEFRILNQTKIINKKLKN